MPYPVALLLAEREPKQYHILRFMKGPNSVVF